MGTDHALAEAVAAQRAGFTRYLTYEEIREQNAALQDAHPDLVRIETVGYSADASTTYPNGRPIETVVIAQPGKERDRPYAYWQLEHTNELTGTLAAVLAARTLCDNPGILDELGCNVVFCNTSHPDGIDLQRWVDKGNGQFDPLLYALWSYRAMPDEQIAWGYPFTRTDQPASAAPEITPEIQASIGIMQRFKPEFFYALHGLPLSWMHTYQGPTQY